MEKLIKYSNVESKPFNDFLRVYSRPLIYKNNDWYVPIFLYNKFINKSNNIINDNIPF